MKKLFHFILPVLLLMIALMILILTTSTIKDAKVACFVILGTLIGFNLAMARWLGMMRTLREKWSVNHLWHVMPGLGLGLLPIGCGLLYLHYQGEVLTFKGVTLIGAAIVFGLIFALLHIMNPKIDLLQDGLQLFVAGYALSICYFAFESIWAPIGMHFANNFTQALFGMSTEPRTLAFHIPLALIAIGLTAVLGRASRSSPTN